MKTNPNTQWFLATLILNIILAIIALFMKNYFAFGGWLMAGFANFVLVFVEAPKNDEKRK